MGWKCRGRRRRSGKRRRWPGRRCRPRKALVLDQAEAPIGEGRCACCCRRHGFPRHGPRTARSSNANKRRPRNSSAGAASSGAFGPDAPARPTAMLPYPAPAHYAAPAYYAAPAVCWAAPVYQAVPAYHAVPEYYFSPHAPADFGAVRQVCVWLRGSACNHSSKRRSRPWWRSSPSTRPGSSARSTGCSREFQTRKL